MSGSSGANIIFDYDKNIVRKVVHINDRNKFAHLRDQYIFMKYISQFKLTPEILNDSFNTNIYFYEIRMMKGNILSENTLSEILVNLSKLIDLPFPIPTQNFSWYLNRLSNHFKYMRNIQTFRELMTFKVFNVETNNNYIEVPNINFYNFFKVGHEIFKDLKPTLCHGDLTLENTVYHNLFIDTNFIFNGWNHAILDISKLFQSYHYDYETTFNKTTKKEWSYIGDNLKINIEDKEFSEKTIKLCEDFLSDYNLDRRHILWFECSHYLRMLKYKIVESKIDMITAYVRLCQVWEDFNTECQEYLRRKW